MKILFSNVKISGNFGFPSIVLAAESLLKTKNAEISFDYEGRNINEYEAKTREMYSLNTADFSNLIHKKRFVFALLSALFFRISGKFIGGSKIVSELRKLAEYSAVIDLYGIVYTDRLPQKKIKRILNVFFPILFVNRLWLLAKVLRVPVIKNTSAIGPCKNLDNKFNAIINLGCLCDLVISRDEISYQICKDLHFKSRCLLSPDTAFCTPIAENIKDIANILTGDDSCVGFGVSYQIAWRFGDKKYSYYMAEIIDFIIRKYNIKIVLIPNEFDRNLKNNDLLFANQIKAIVKEKFGQDVYVMDPEGLRADEIKKFISTCSAVVTARYHTMVAALSTGTPVLVISWHHKYITAMKMFNCEEYVVEAENFSLDELKEKFSKFYENKSFIRSNIEANLNTVKAKVESSVDEIYKFILTKMDNNA